MLNVKTTHKIAFKWWQTVKDRKLSPVIGDAKETDINWVKRYTTTILK